MRLAEGRRQSADRRHGVALLQHFLHPLFPHVGIISDEPIAPQLDQARHVVAPVHRPGHDGQAAIVGLSQERLVYEAVVRAVDGRRDAGSLQLTVPRYLTSNSKKR